MAITTSDGPDQPTRERGEDTRRAVIVRIPQRLLTSIDAAAKRLGLSRAALLLSSTIKELERMGQG